MLLVAPGLTTSNKKLLVSKGIATRSKDARSTTTEHCSLSLLFRTLAHHIRLCMAYGGARRRLPAPDGDAAQDAALSTNRRS